jgi:AcrR family transcriptional regulator
MRALLLAVGERGYAKASVQDALDRTGVPRSVFYRHFENKADCFARAYEFEAERLQDEVAAAGERSGWIAGLRAALSRLLGYLSEEPTLARALLIEGRGAGGPTLARYEVVVERLSHAVDSARREVGSQASPPPLTGRLIVAAIEAGAMAWLLDEQASDPLSLLPGLLHFSALYYFGEGTALEAFDRG